jgi:hypothetical protein
MNRRAASSPDVAALGIVGVALCCGLPLLLAAGAGVAVVGVGLRSWALILAGAWKTCSPSNKTSRSRHSGCYGPW